MDKLQHLFQLQKLFGSKFTNFDELNEHERQIKTLEFIDHLIEELIELRRECPIRKHWSKKRFNIPDKQKQLDEYVDALHFFITIALVNGWSAQNVYDAYLSKNAVNHQRQDNSY